jgi:hypothetical protein
MVRAKLCKQNVVFQRCGRRTDAEQVRKAMAQRRSPEVCWALDRWPPLRALPLVSERPR